MNRFEVGQNTAIEPVADSRCSSALVQMDAVAEQRFRSQQAVAVVDVGVAVGLRIEPPGGRDLVEILGQMGLHVDFGMLAHQSTRGLSCPSVEVRANRGVIA